MARSHARLLTAVWSNPDFIALDVAAQRLYFLLLSQPKATLCGVLDLVPGRWARLAGDTDTAGIEATLRRLDAARFIVVDEEHAELVVRTFIRHDGATRSWQLRTAMWASWEGISSPRIRALLVAEMPPEVWTCDRVHPPAAAVALRQTSGAPFTTEPQVNNPSDAPPPINPDGNCQLPEALSLNPEANPRTPPTPSPPRNARPPAVNASSPDGDQHVSEAFDALWASYPKDRRIDRAKARRLYQRAVKAGADPVAIQAGLDRWCAHWRAEQTEAQYIAHITTWLNGQRWENDPPAPRTTQRTRPKGFEAIERVARARGVIQ